MMMVKFKMINELSDIINLMLFQNKNGITFEQIFKQKKM